MDQQCPYCKSSNVLFIIYGYPSEEQIKMEVRGEVIIGSCVPGKNSPNFLCKNCNQYFRFDQLKTNNSSE